uniref:DUF3504 domain-containing protein n=1 Tax=Strigamia maritima TaxID=126957 RepID=T1IRV3_STRMM
MAASRWGDVDVQTIDISIDQPIPTNTRKNHTSIWHQFTEFCSSKNYSLTPVTTTITLNQILKDFAWNMRKTDGTEYKETVIKVLWNTTAKLLQQYYFDNFNIIFNPFNDVEFKTARAARDAKRKKLLSDGTKRKLSLFTSSLSDRQEKAKLHKVYDENTPEGLLEKFYKVVAPELGWKNVEGSAAEITHFSREIDYKGNETGRIEYNPATVWRPDCKRLIPNRDDPEVCPVRLFNLVLERRPSHITINRLLLFPNNFWREKNSKGWYKNMPVGKKLINKWLSNTPSEDVVELDEPPCTDKVYPKSEPLVLKILMPIQ